ncbi:MAG: hypothetical protein KDB14_07855 [Planctomycetales bacterium]|nr:hypothetical protein [Planctomycetales bacterium]
MNLQGKVLWGVLAAMAASTGCMVTPTEGEYFNSFNTPIPTAGFTEKPSQTVHVEVYNVLARRWDRLATTTSKSTAVRWGDKNWYYWQAPSLRLLPRHWDLAGNLLSAKIRAVGADGNYLWTFDEWNIWDAEHISDLHVNAKFEVTVESFTFDPDTFYEYDPGTFYGYDQGQLPMKR